MLPTKKRLSWSRWFDLLLNRPIRAQLPPLHLLHRWQGGMARCAECGSADYDNPLHLHPSTHLITIRDVMTEWSKERSYPARIRVAGSLLGLASAVVYVDDEAVVYMADGWPGMVFVELGDRSKRSLVRHFAENYRTVGVLLVFVGCEN